MPSKIASIQKDAPKKNLQWAMQPSVLLSKPLSWAPKWVMMDATSEAIYHTVGTPVPGGGSGTMSANWSPGQIYSGNYKAVVYINGEVSTEKNSPSNSTILFLILSCP